MQLVVLGLNHKTAPVPVRERFSFDKQELAKALDKLYEETGIAECVLLSTCNRTELYVALDGYSSSDEGRNTDTLKQTVLQILGRIKGSQVEEADRSYFYFYEDDACLDHLFRVSSSLDSLVVGEGQILSQLKMAYVAAYSHGLTGPVFNIIFQKAISVGKKVRATTGIADTPVSVSYAAVNLAEDCLEKPLAEAKVLILGAGTMSELTATHLAAKGVTSIFVSNRTYTKAQELAHRFHGQAVAFDNFATEAQSADILITSTGAPHYIIRPELAQTIMENRQGRPLVMIDIAVPRDIDPEVAQVEGIYLFNIDSLSKVVEANKQHRLEEAKKAEPIIAKALSEIHEKLNYLSVRPMMVFLSDRADQIRRRELHRALVKLPDASDHDRRIMDSMSRMIVRKLLRDPMIHFNEIAGKEDEAMYWKLFGDMFNLK